MGKDSTLNLRIPVWTNSEGAKVPLDGQSLKVPASGDLTAARCVFYCSLQVVKMRITLDLLVSLQVIFYQ